VGDWRDGGHAWPIGGNIGANIGKNQKRISTNYLMI
jgi:hypothetical protein